MDNQHHNCPSNTIYSTIVFIWYISCPTHTVICMFTLTNMLLSIKLPMSSYNLIRIFPLSVWHLKTVSLWSIFAPTSVQCILDQITLCVSKLVLHVHLSLYYSLPFISHYFTSSPMNKRCNNGTYWLKSIITASQRHIFLLLQHMMLHSFTISRCTQWSRYVALIKEDWG